MSCDSTSRLDRSPLLSFVPSHKTQAWRAADCPRPIQTHYQPRTLPFHNIRRAVIARHPLSCRAGCTPEAYVSDGPAQICWLIQPWPRRMAHVSRDIDQRDVQGRRGSECHCRVNEAQTCKLRSYSKDACRTCCCSELHFTAACPVVSAHARPRAAQLQQRIKLVHHFRMLPCLHDESPRWSVQQECLAGTAHTRCTDAML